MNNEPAPEELSAELEVRIVAFLLGEASDFEREEIERLIEERSDVREFKNQMQEMHGLLGHAAGGVPLVAEGDDAIVSGNTDVCGDDWKLSQDKRADVLALFDDQVPDDPISLADVGSESLLGHPDSRSVRAGSRFAGGGFAGLWGRLVLWTRHSKAQRIPSRPCFSKLGWNNHRDVDVAGGTVSVQG